MLHKQLTVHASWVTSLQGMEDLTLLLAREALHPETVVSHRYKLGEADEAYPSGPGGAAGKVVLLPGG